MKRYQVLDLFSGAGGMAEGFLQAGFDIPFASDRSPQAALTYEYRHREQLGYKLDYFCGDVQELAEEKKLREFLGKEFFNIDVICGGPPCQGFSMAGKRNPDDLRNQLVRSYINILKQVQPKYFVMENVTGILSAKFSVYQGQYQDYENELVTKVLLKEFREIGYENVVVKTLDASDYGVPQRRKRVIFLGTRDDINIHLLHPEPLKTNKISAKDALSDLENIEIGSKEEEYRREVESEYQRDSRKGRTPNSKSKKVKSQKLVNHETSKHTPLVIERFNLLSPGDDFKKIYNNLSEDQQERYKTRKHNCRRMLPNEPSPTVLTLPDDMVHYSKNRILTVRELARLQSFDDSFEFLGKRTTGGVLRKQETPQYTLVGNAVPPLLAKAIALEIKKNLDLLGIENYDHRKVAL
ncbi:DNA cytosine methyltransferase [Acinetobacter pittii]|uniref:DNA cytosine methyltransferase n=1 Tax=Acinetobacter calcoaceticus/baumannii complex TaxID=909768 RepID=UPI00045009B0|nr:MULTISPECIES: DNA cytosine methyltransferase [Acinetobacter calcoaceticus/baumannii complex]EXR38542.1 DNA (cytosine-5-)-methyltransferase family protein [Acinetobacter sp. 1294243]MCK0878553.1 DNA cytosine methyltransferase [Acinetobacter pittii]OCY17111.1 DNA (cytosine-5-)-methyltransferase [Acinetobacter pittii]RSO88625.1 DNA cytosine methyltransferase [Acinetobacter pittii]